MKKQNISLKQVKEFQQYHLTKKQKDALQRSRDFYYQACEANSDAESLRFLEKAIDCEVISADAILMQSELCDEDDEERLWHSLIAMKAGLLEIGEDFDSYVGHFWGCHETRPFMRALETHARVLRDLTAYARAIVDFTLMLKLNPNDNQGVRYELLPLLIVESEIGEAKKILKNYPEDSGVVWTSLKLLIAYTDENASDLIAQISTDPKLAHVHTMLKLLTGKKKFIPHEQATYRAWSDEEARVYYPVVRLAWEATPGAIEWLKKMMSKTK